MAKVQSTQEALMAKVLAATTANVVKARGTSGKITYLDRFVKILLDENGEPITKGKTRTEIIALMSLEICTEICEGEGTVFSLETEEDIALLAEVNEKVKNQVAAAVSDSNNSTALSYNVKYKDVWVVVKEGSLVRLAHKTAVEAPVEAPVEAKEEAAAE